MSYQQIGIGTVANDGTGDSARTSFTKTNSNILELYSRGIAPYETAIDYTVGALTVGSDFNVYKCLANNGPGSTVRNPVGDTSGSWELQTARPKDTEQLGSVTLATNVYTFTPDSGVFRPLATGLVIKFFLPATANTAAVDINYNGTTVDFTWIDSSQFVSGDLDDTYNKQMITARYDGTAFRCLSDISGQNTNGRWDKKSNGALICQQEKTDASNVTTASGSLFRSVIDQSWTYPKEFSDSAVVNQGSILDINGADIGIFAVKFYSKSTTSVTYEFWAAVSVSSTGVSHELLATGRWY